MSTLTDHLNLSPRCQHLMNDGRYCGTPAMRGRQFCRPHDRIQRGAQIDPNHSCHVIPSLKSPRDIRIAATNIIRDLRDGRLDLQQARLMVSALRIANRTLKKRADLSPYGRQSFRELTRKSPVSRELASAPSVSC